MIILKRNRSNKKTATSRRTYKITRRIIEASKRKRSEEQKSSDKGHNKKNNYIKMISKIINNILWIL